MVWLLLLLVFAVPFVCYYPVGLIIRPLRYVWGVLMVAALSAAITFFLIGGFHVADVSPDLIENLRVMWGNFLTDLQELQRQYNTGQYNWEMWFWHGSIAVNILLSMIWSIVFTTLFIVKKPEELFFEPLYLVAVIGWLGLLVCEFLLYLVIGIIFMIWSAIMDGTAVTFALGVVFFFALIGGGGGTIIIIHMKD